MGLDVKCLLLRPTLFLAIRSHFGSSYIVQNLVSISLHLLVMIQATLLNRVFLLIQLTGSSTGMSLSRSSLEGTRREKFLLIYPEKKLAMCIIPKVACTTFARMFNEMNYGEYAESPKNPPSNVDFHQMSNCAHLGHCEDVTTANGWTIAVFGRNPVERYVSAFRSKCTAEPHNSGRCGAHCGRPGDPEDGGAYCEGDVLWDVNATLSERVQAFEVRALRDVKRGSLPHNEHWVTQTSAVQELCGLQRSAFNFVGSMNSPLLPQVKSLLQRVKHPNASTISNDLINQDSHCTSCSPQSMATSLKTFLRSSEVVDGLMHLYADDYGFFNLREKSLDVEDVAKMYAANEVYDIDESGGLESRRVEAARET